MEDQNEELIIFVGNNGNDNTNTTNLDIDQLLVLWTFTI